jgi:hypothetical protein
LFTLTEPITSVTSAQAISAQFTVVRVENSTLNDSSTQQSNFLQSITEAIRLLDIMCYNGWFRIDDSQAADWGAINEGQTAEWIAIGPEQAAAWEAIDSAETANWGNIDGEQTPDWGTINTKQPCS